MKSDLGLQFLLSYSSQKKINLNFTFLSQGLKILFSRRNWNWFGLINFNFDWLWWFSFDSSDTQMIKLLRVWKKERRNKEIKKGAVRKSPTVKVTAIKHNLIKTKIVKQCLRVFFFTYDDWSWGVIKWNDWSLSLLSSSNVIQINRQATIKHK